VKKSRDTQRLSPPEKELQCVDPPLSLSVHTPIALSSSDAHRYSLYTPELNLMAETEQTASATPAIAYESIGFGGQPLAQSTPPREPLTGHSPITSDADSPNGCLRRRGLARGI